MIGHRVRVVRREGVPITGTLHSLTELGATVWREGTLPEQQGNVFTPMANIIEMIDLGRAPG